MTMNANTFIARSMCSVALVMLITIAPPETVRATTNGSYNKNVPNLAGTWQINRRKSDDPQSKFREAVNRGHAGGLRGSRSSVAGGFPGDTPHGGVSDGGNSPGRDEMETVRIRLEERMLAADVLEIIQTDSEITVNETGNERLVRTQTFYTDARKSEQENELGKIETKARWQGNKFIVVTKEGAGRITRIYELKSRGRELYVTLKLENQRTRQTMSIRSVYNRSL